jgi:hypothetical protein
MKQDEVNKFAKQLAREGLREEEVRKTLFRTKGIRVTQIRKALNWKGE